MEFPEVKYISGLMLNHGDLNFDELKSIVNNGYP